MSNKAELAALMASDGDYEKKISLLKKAVVAVTKQKQEIETRQTQLQEELRTATQHLTEAQRENAALQRKVKTLEAQVEQQRSSGSAFGQNMLKGLSSIMGSNDAGGRAGGRGGRGSDTRAQLALSAEDVERLVTENEQLHREKYTYQTKFEDAQRTGTKDAENLRNDVARLQRELGELHGTLDTVTGQCDRLNADYLVERALGDFCRHFFVAALRRSTASLTSLGGAEVVAELQWPAAPRTQPQPAPSPLSSSRNDLPAESPPSPSSPALLSGAMPAEALEQVVRALQSSCGTVKTLLRAISVLIVVLREQLPRRERATVGDLECLRDRLCVFLDAHTIKKDRLMYFLEQLDTHLASLLIPIDAVAKDGAAPTAETLAAAQDEVLQLFLEWLGLLRAQTPLLVESCVSYLSPGHTYTLHARRGATSGHSEEDVARPALTSPSRTTTDRAEFVEEVTKYGYATLASVEGALTAARMLLQRSPTAYGSSPRAVNAEGDVPRNGRVLGDEVDAVGDTDQLNTPPRGAASSVVEVGALLALQRFWWEGCTSARALHTSARVLDGGVQDLAEACNKSEVRDALLYLSRCLRSLATASADIELREKDTEAVMEAVRPAKCFCSGGCGEGGVSGDASTKLPSAASSRAATAAVVAANGHGRDGRISLLPASAEAYEEVLVALAAADRAAVAYYTQMNYLYRELADKEDAVQTAAEAVRQMKKLLEMERTESEHTQQTMQAQISVLSNQLIEMADAAQAPQLPRPH
ncbi:hypothetical protein ABB37_04819 [Leptomonas pyrrhocoris]|uniref:Uncharacterized protein n=1 Tax=Leptomonas pyrrhocoris TaxID=157538 RepID=A0A0N0VFC9_LEPPY|nr:hypothetical protein ABB37_04819 [Leptomonas pyrrhocoris]KPA80628.1 hypothetical protein ABB37_04819 [Leptomonas pyrrhocoris]|eukprot:XP_015659067.1 hypothetical protein ABB37_04819 [Leptomonas pyrrhocoris]